MNETLGNREELHEYIKKEINVILQENPDVLDKICLSFQTRFTDKKTTEDRIDRVLQELKQDREYSERRWEASEKKWKESTQASEKRWKELKDDSEKRWNDSKQQFEKMFQELKDLRISHKKMDERFQNTIGALGSRWGVHSETSFRNGLKAILEDRFGVKVENLNIKDEEGFVFHRPEQVEMDVIIINGDIGYRNNKNIR